MSYIWFSAVLTLEKAELLTRHFDERAPPNAGARFMIDPGNPGAEFPPLYSRWLAELLPGPIPRETRATCNDCAMCAPDGHQDGAEKEYFDPAIKCCTYVPEIHNFLAGGVLSDDDPSAQPGRATVEKRIRTGVAVTPLGLKQPAVFSLFEFYVECARLVNALSWKEVLEIGPEARAFASLTLDAYNNLISDQVPGTLKAGSVHLVQLRHDMTRVSAYSIYDPIDIPRIVMESLHYFDGRPVPDAVGAIAAEKGVVLDQSLVLKMVDFGVLVPTE